MAKIKQTAHDELLNKEVLHEYGVGICAAFNRFARRNNISLKDEESPIMQASYKAHELAQELYPAKTERVREIETELHNLKKYLHEVDPDAII